MAIIKIGLDDLAGARGFFEFVMFNQQKASILSKLGPIVNDAMSGMVAGCSLNMYTVASRRWR